MKEVLKMSSPTICADTRNATSSPESASGHTHSDLPDGRMTDLFGRVVVPASPSAPPAKAEEQQTSATCGRSGSTSSASAVLTRSLVNRLKQRLGTDGSILFNLIWKEKGTPSRRSVSLLRASGRRTFDSDCGSWPTPSQRDHKGGYQGGRIRDGKVSLDTLDVACQLAAWTTPSATDGSRAGTMTPAMTGSSLTQLVSLAGWPTPQTMDTLPPMDYERRLNHPSRPGCTVSGNLREVVTLAQPARITSSGQLLTVSSAGMESGGQLNPAHSRWLMGLPPEWDDCAPTATRLSRKSRQK